MENNNISHELPESRMTNAEARAANLEDIRAEIGKWAAGLDKLRIIEQASELKDSDEV